ncbi:MAG: dTDP-4-dehydrorhamnose reductase [Abditibacteriota bacterium]|nr:dTDP-4-dehydrorhamnose reductase [Abditibacteriota bacterium]
MKSYSKVLVTGASGQLARALMQAAPQQTQCVGVTRHELDISDDCAVWETLEAHKPELVFNGAAYNLVDKAESDGQADALRVNALGPARLAKACREMEIPLVHFSTDFVFDGHKRQPYEETDAAQPLGVYGASKLAGENIVVAASPRHFAIRVCRLYGPIPANGATQKPAGNFPLLMLKLASERESVRVVNDQVGTPTYTPDLARAVWQLVQNSEGGLYQLSNAGEVAFDEYARTVFEIAGASCRVEGISSEEYNAPARRPRYSTMSNEKAHRCGVVPLRDWREALEEFLVAV